MNSSNPATGTTRRSFIKRSVVAAVAVSSLTIFSGLVNAAGERANCYDLGVGTGRQCRLHPGPGILAGVFVCERCSDDTYIMTCDANGNVLVCASR